VDDSSGNCHLIVHFIYKLFLDTSIIGAFVLIALLATLVLAAVKMYERFNIGKEKTVSVMNRTTVLESLKRVFKGL